MRSYGLKDIVIVGTMALFLAVGAVPAQAIPIEVDFTATNFGTGATIDPVSGSFIYEAVN